MARKANLKIQRWDNGLAVRIPSSVARSVGFRAGQPIELSTQDSAVLVSAAGEPDLTLRRMLALCDPKRHGGEVMASAPVRKEVL